MQKFKYQTFHNLKPHHLNILQSNSATTAFDRIHRNDYMVAAKSDTMFELINKLFPRINQDHQTDRQHSTKYGQLRGKYVILFIEISFIIV